MRVVLLAPPGAGKGTQGARISERYGVPLIGSGELFRAQVARGGPIADQVRGYLVSGELVPDDVVIALLHEPILAAARTCGGFVLDGFPRTLGQAHAAAAWARSEGIPAQAALHLDAPEDVLVGRMLARAAQTGRVDDAETTMRRRLTVYKEKTRPLLDYYADRGVLITVDATPPVEDVSASIFKALDEIRDRT